LHLVGCLYYYRINTIFGLLHAVRFTLNCQTPRKCHRVSLAALLIQKFHNFSENKILCLNYSWFILYKRCRDSSVAIGTRLCASCTWVRIPARQREFSLSQNVKTAVAAFCSAGIGVFSCEKIYQGKGGEVVNAPRSRMNEAIMSLHTYAFRSLTDSFTVTFTVPFPLPLPLLYLYLYLYFIFTFTFTLSLPLPLLSLYLYLYFIFTFTFTLSLPLPLLYLYFHFTLPLPLLYLYLYLYLHSVHLNKCRSS